jgi:hypothetical protein
MRMAPGVAPALTGAAAASVALMLSVIDSKHR